MDILHKIKTYLISVGIMATTMSGVVGCQPAEKKADNAKKDKIEVVDSQTVKQKVTNPVLKVEYRTDTLQNESSSILLVHVKGNITRFYKENNPSFVQKLRLYVHERWHKHNYELGFRNSYAFTPLEYYKLCFHDEISANVAALLTARYEYLAANDKDKKLKEFENSEFGYYFKAVKQGKIKPESSNLKNIEAERYFVVNETKNMWMKKYAPVYAKRTYGMLKRYLERKGFINNSESNYSNILTEMYKIGGVDFAKYMQKDIQPTSNQTEITENMKDVVSFKKNVKFILEEFNAKYPLLNEVDLDKRQNVLQHIFIAAKMKQKLKGISAEDLVSHKNIVSSCYNKMVSDLSSDANFVDFINKTNCVINDKFTLGNNEKYLEVIDKIYSFNSVELNKLITNFSPDKVVVNNEFNIKDFKFNNNIATPFNAINNLDVDIKIKKLKEQKKLYSLAPNTSASNKKTEKRCISDLQYIDVPNFCEPILVASTPEQNAEILKTVRKFDEMPAVLKSCNTKAINEYIAKNGKYER